MHRSTQVHVFAGVCSLLLAGCASSSQQRVDHQATAVVDSCATASSLRALARPFLISGRLDRTLRLLRKANRLCPASAPETWAAEVETLAQLSHCHEASTLAATIANADGADETIKSAARRALQHCEIVERRPVNAEQARQTSLQFYEDGLTLAEKKDDESLREAEKKFLLAWETFRPNPKALVGAGLAAKRRMQDQEAQQLFDRALAEAEIIAGKPVELEVGNGFSLDRFDNAALVFFSNDSQYIAFAYGLEIAILDRAFREVRRIRGHTQPVVSVAFSPDGKTIASASEGNTIRIWNFSTGEQVRKLAGHTGSITSVAYAVDGKTLASASRDNTIRLWDVDTGKQRAMLAGHKGDVHRVVYSPNGKTLASLSEDKTIRFWNAATGEEQSVLQTKARPRFGDIIEYSSDGKTLRLESMAEDGHVWSIETNQEIQTIRPQSPDENRAYVSPDGTLRITVADGRIEAQSIAKKKIVRILEPHAIAFDGLGYSVDGQLLAAITGTRYFTWALTKPGGYRVSMTISKPLPIPFSRSMAWSLSQTLSAAGYDMNTDFPFQVAHSGEFGVVVLESNTIGLVDIGKRALKKSFEPLEQAILEIDISPDDKMIASRLADGTITLWDADSGAKFRLLDRNAQTTENSSEMEFAPDGRTIATTAPGALHVWNVTTGTIVRTWPLADDAWKIMAFSPNGRTLAVQSRDQKVHLVDIASGDVRVTFGKSFDRILFSPDGKMLLGASAGKKTRFWDTSTGKPLHEFSGHFSEIRYMPSGHHIVAKDDEGLLEFVDVATGKLSAKIGALPPRDEVNDYNPDVHVLPIEASYVFTASGHIDIMGKDACDVRPYPVCRIGSMVFPFDVCEERLLVPGILAKLHEGDMSYLEPEAAPIMMNCRDVPTH